MPCWPKVKMCSRRKRNCLSEQQIVNPSKGWSNAPFNGDVIRTLRRKRAPRARDSALSIAGKHWLLGSARGIESHFSQGRNYSRI